LTGKELEYLKNYVTEQITANGIMKNGEFSQSELQLKWLQDERDSAIRIRNKPHVVDERKDLNAKYSGAIQASKKKSKRN